MRFDPLSTAWMLLLLSGSVSELNAQEKCKTTLDCAQLMVEIVARQKADIEQLMKRVDDLEKMSGRIEMVTISAKKLRCDFDKPFINTPKVFVSLVGIDAFNLARPDGTHLYIKDIDVEKVDNAGITLKKPNYAGSAVDDVTLLCVAFGK